ncbi:hypothetical protein BDZ89DRAFT_1062431 [Hymenopellis radicata]|nr:hypothetical protein BDZ89DRAFT_1062431 [Hymenopellis radicata]
MRIISNPTPHCRFPPRVTAVDLASPVITRRRVRGQARRTSTSCLIAAVKGCLLAPPR